MDQVISFGSKQRNKSRNKEVKRHICGARKRRCEKTNLLIDFLFDFIVVHGVFFDFVLLFVLP